MGIFYTQIPVFNRAPININVRFDGQDIELTPGVNHLPEVAINGFGKNQNPIMGTQDPNNPHISGGDYLLGIIGVDNCEPLTKEEWEAHLGRPCRMDEKVIFEEKYGNDPKAKQIVMGKSRTYFAKSRAEAGTAPRGESTFEQRD